jgi:hypothetical protein
MFNQTPSGLPSHSFIVRIWQEQREFSSSPPEWRGVIEHIPDGERQYFQQIEEILPFMQIFINANSRLSG